MVPCLRAKNDTHWKLTKESENIAVSGPHVSTHKNTIPLSVMDHGDMIHVHHLDFIMHVTVAALEIHIRNLDTELRYNLKMHLFPLLAAGRRVHRFVCGSDLIYSWFYTCFFFRFSSTHSALSLFFICSFQRFLLIWRMDHFSFLSLCIYIPSADVISWPHAPATIPTSPLSLSKLPLPTILLPYPPTTVAPTLLFPLNA